MLGREKGMRPTGRRDQRNLPRTGRERARRCDADLKAAPRLRSGRVLIAFEAASLRRSGWNSLTAGKVSPVAVNREWYQSVWKAPSIPIKIKNRIDERMT